MPLQHGVLWSLSTFSCLILLSNCVPIKVYENPAGSSIINSMVLTLLKKCDLGIKNIVIYDTTRNSYIFESIMALQSISIVAVSSLKQSILLGVPHMCIKEIEMNIQGIISIIDLHRSHNFIFSILATQWNCFKNCTFIVMSKSNYRCSDEYVERVIRLASRQYAFGIYFLCLENGNNPVIYAYDQYGDIRLSPWKLVDKMQPYYRKGTLYYRTFQKDNTCLGFHFNYSVHTDLIHKSILTGIPPWIIMPNKLVADGIYNETIFNKLDHTRSDHFDVLQRSTGFKFKYCVDTHRLKYVDQKPIYQIYFLGHWAGDFVVEPVRSTFSNFWELSDPIEFDYYVIFSHNRGFQTPLEKFANYYGRWTLISLTIIMILTFIVIWFKTKKNIAFATFDVLRLLINAEIYVPINTSTLKIYFSVMFLYFMVIHATFSGRLAEFLTKPELRNNIDTIEELISPRIKNIYNFGFAYDEDVDQEILNKTINVARASECAIRVQHNSNSASIGIGRYYTEFVESKRDFDYQLYIGQSKLASLRTSVAFRRGFPLLEPLNRAMIYLRDTGINEAIYSIHNQKVKLFLKMRELNFQAQYRSITLNDLFFAFVLLIIGNSLALICLLCEILIYRCSKLSVKLIKVEMFNHNRISNQSEGFKSLFYQGKFKSYISRKILLRKQHDGS